MSANLIDPNLLKTLIPASSLNGDNFQELASKSTVQQIPAGGSIFKAGDTDRKSVYLLEGEVHLTDANDKIVIVRSGSDVAKHPMANHQPRKHTAIARVPCTITRLDSDLLDILMTWDQLSGIEVSEIGFEGKNESDWMTRILQSKAFLQVPPANIQAMFMRIKEVSFNAGEAVIRQGEDGDYYYIIKNGKCKVTRTSKTGSELTLATLGNGDAFGEEALLSKTKRNANIVMTTDGILMRLSKEDFNELLKEPMLNWVDKIQALNLAKTGAVWIDVRLESEYKNSGIKGSLNIPLFMLRLKAESLDPSKKYILYCDTGRQSSAGAFLLGERGIDAYCLQGGLTGSS